MRTATLLPDADTLHLEALVADAERITVVVTTRGETACCPDCGQPSRQLHSRKRHRLADLPWQGLAVCLDRQLRRFSCRTPTCVRRTFTERVPCASATRGRSPAGWTRPPAVRRPSSANWRRGWHKTATPWTRPSAWSGATARLRAMSTN